MNANDIHICPSCDRVWDKADPSLQADACWYNPYHGVAFRDADQRAQRKEG